MRTNVAPFRPSPVYAALYNHPPSDALNTSAMEIGRSRTDIREIAMESDDAREVWRAMRLLEAAAMDLQTVREELNARFERLQGR